ncbi:vitamin K epoxide reductase family protein [Kitasatospora sp. NBC_00240]|uniref:vitamin K epoxide reductase family protein n=1 Tax=Kitasatospora sp. NBC_00240 TaxID=2903567 RepID=UPI0022537286|nr:vitamin K epoxide reductase family protein [Kitasatospora sp. NBC_00240]MCX5208928.1 vitamin K epoxide reductase family protein [Kitasatospora sp. NBC_00240]
MTPAGPESTGTTVAGGGPIGASRAFAWLLVVTGALGLTASVVLTIDKIRLLQDPSYVPNCNINPIISCGSVMGSDQAEAFGFPNSLIGLIGFSVVVAIGVGLLAGARYRRWFWLGLQAGTVFGVGFVTWLMIQTLYRIGALCPYCMLVWAAMIPLFWYTTLHSLRSGVIPVSARLRPAVREALRYHWVVPALWYAVIALLILSRFWYYWRTLI